jgi:hypothetical protein
MWTAYAVRTATGDRYGDAFTAPTEADAVAELVRWLEWQQAHSAALEALRAAERAYHRTLAAQAVAGSESDPASLQSRRESLAQLREISAALDRIREQRPADHS